MAKYVFFLFVVFAILSCRNSEQYTTHSHENSDFSDTLSYIFPDDWLGIWKGDLVLRSMGSNVTRSLQTELHIIETDTANQWTWTIVYIDTTKDFQDERKYTLIAKDSSLSHFVVDEKNSIYLDQYLIGNNMVSRFAVNKSLLFANYHLRGDRIESEIFSGKMDEPVVTGESLPDSSGVEKVLSYPVGFMQQATLFKE